MILRSTVDRDESVHENVLELLKNLMENTLGAGAAPSDGSKAAV
jgi:hypothetical protein